MPLGFLLIVFLTTVVHELGHIIAGWCVGFRFKGIYADPFRLRIDSGQWKFRVRPRLFRDFALMTLDRVRRVRQRLIAFTAGGPLTSLLSGITAIIAGELVLARSNWPGWGALLDCFGVWSLFIAGASLLYLREGHVTEGMILRALLFSRTEAEQLVATYAMSALRSDALIPPDYLRRWFRVASLPGRLRTGEYFASWLTYLKEENATVAAQCLERCLAGSEMMDEDMRDSLVAEAAFFNAYRRGDIEKAEKWWKQLMFPETHNPLSRTRVETARAWACQQYDVALRRVDDGIEILQNLSATTARRRLMESWMRWREEIVKRSPETA